MSIKNSNGITFNSAMHVKACEYIMKNVDDPELEGYILKSLINMDEDVNNTTAGRSKVVCHPTCDISTIEVPCEDSVDRLLLTTAILTSGTILHEDDRFLREANNNAIARERNIKLIKQELEECTT